MSKSDNPFRYFNSPFEVIRLVVMMYVRFPLSLRNVEDLHHLVDRQTYKLPWPSGSRSWPDDRQTPSLVRQSLGAVWQQSDLTRRAHLGIILWFRWGTHGLLVFWHLSGDGMARHVGAALPGVTGKADQQHRATQFYS